MIILGIETSCDETAISIIEAEGESLSELKINVLANEILSQIALHRKFGGVFPMLAKREHAKTLVPLFLKCLEEANLIKSTQHNSESRIKNKELGVENNELWESKNRSEILSQIAIDEKREPEMWEQFFKKIPSLTKPPIDAIAVTEGPGLEPALWTGINFARALSVLWKIPLIPINHMEGHIFASLLRRENEIQDSRFKIQDIQFPAIVLLVSGGHTELIKLEGPFQYEVLGATRDDAAGEAFDKVARILKLPYPGGPEISKLAEGWREKSIEGIGIEFPRPMIHSKDFDFSFSGLKTSVLYFVKKLPKLTDEITAEICAEFESAVVESLLTKTKRAVEENSAETLIVGGGVAANKFLRESLTKMATELKINLYISEIPHSTDNALMIAVAATARLLSNLQTLPSVSPIAFGNLKLGKVD